MKNRKWKQSKWEWYGRASTTVRSRAVWPTGRSLWAVGWPTCNILVVPYAVHVSPAQPINLVWAMSDSLSSGKPFPITMTLPPKSQSYSTSFSTINNIRKQIRYYIHSWYCIITCFFFFLILIQYIQVNILVCKRPKLLYLRYIWKTYISMNEFRTYNTKV